ncbi:hypothetical protein GW944_00285 [Candidatus Parcubacteria bacterium]|nr:hypothetical protein [Candidatus Parcubacteria bacterium]
MNIKKLFVNKKFLGIIFLVMFVFSALPAMNTKILAQEETGYVPLVELPTNYVPADGEKRVKASDYIEGLFKLIIAIAGTLAVVTIIVGGIQYMSSDAFGKTEAAKNTIGNAIWGFMLAISAWLILNTISPKLVSFNLSITPIETNNTNPDGENGAPGGGSGLSGEQVLSALTEARIKVVGNPRLDGLRLEIIDEIGGLKRSCDCEVILTSATGGSHRAGDYSHANGYKVDLRSNREGVDMTRYITNNYQTLPDRDDGAKMYLSPTGGIYALEADHWDVVKH